MRQLNNPPHLHLLPAQAFGPNVPLELVVVGDDLPILLGTSGGQLNATIQGNVTFSAIFPNGTVVAAFTLAVDVDAIATAAVRQSATKAALTANLTYVGVSLSQAWSAIGTIDVSLIQSVTSFICAKVLVPEINKKANEGFPLPSFDGLALVNPDVVVTPSGVRIDTDISYTPSAEAPAPNQTV